MDALSNYLAAQGLTRKAFARRCRISPSTITRILKGEVNVTADLARTINAVTDGAVTPNDLILRPQEQGADSSTSADPSGEQS